MRENNTRDNKIYERFRRDTEGPVLGLSHRSPNKAVIGESQWRLFCFIGAHMASSADRLSSLTVRRGIGETPVRKTEGVHSKPDFCESNCQIVGFR